MCTFNIETRSFSSTPNTFFHFNFLGPHKSYFISRHKKVLVPIFSTTARVKLIDQWKGP